MGNQSFRMQLEINKHEQISKTAKNCSLCAYLFHYLNQMIFLMRHEKNHLISC